MKHHQMLNHNSNPPNIIFIITHDTGDHFGCYNRKIETPNIDNLAQKGVIFTNHFCSAPQCSPSRGSILTGKMPHTNGLMGLVNRGWFLPESNQTLPKLLENEAGYSTYLVGLQHEHTEPQALGYQHILLASDVFPISDNIVPKALSFLQDVEAGIIKQPFFCNIGFYDTHRPYIYPGTIEIPETDTITVPKYLPDDEEIKNDIADFHGAVKHIDNNIGKILTALEGTSYAENTLVIYTVDHGWAMPKAKCTLYDSGIKTALMMYWPGKIAGKRYPQLISNIDILPTILDIIKINKPEDLEGTSFFRLLFDPDNHIEREKIFAELTYHDCYNAMRAIRSKKWKFIKNFEILPNQFEIPDGFSKTKTAEVYIQHHPEYNTPRTSKELYDLEKDPYELKNLSDDPRFAEIMNFLENELMTWLESTEDPILHGKIKAPPGSLDENL